VGLPRQRTLAHTTTTTTTTSSRRYTVTDTRHLSPKTDRAFWDAVHQCEALHDGAMHDRHICILRQMLAAKHRPHPDEVGLTFGISGSRVKFLATCDTELRRCPGCNHPARIRQGEFVQHQGCGRGSLTPAGDEAA
jgi:hypothetical protein